MVSVSILPTPTYFALVLFIASIPLQVHAKAQERAPQRSAETDIQTPAKRGESARIESEPEKKKTAEFAKELRQGDFTQAERIARIQGLLDRELERQAQTQKTIDDLQQQFDEASEAFRQIDEEYVLKRSRLKGLTDEKAKADLQSDLDETHEKWTAARNHFNSIIGRQKIAQQQLDTILEKISLGQAILDFLVTGDVRSDSTKGEDTDAVPSLKPGSVEKEKDAAQREEKQPSTPRSQLDRVIPGAPGVGPESDRKLQAENQEEKLDVVVADERLADARRDVKQREQTLEAALRELELLEQGVSLFERDLANAERLVASAREAMAEQERAVQRLEQRLAAGTANGDAGRLDVLRQQLEHARADQVANRVEFEKQSARVVEVRTLLDQLRGSRTQAAARVTEAREALESAQSKLWFLESPLAPHRLMNWFVENGPKILGILLLMFLGWWAAKLVGAKLISGLIRRSYHGTPESRQMRAETMRRVFQSTADVAVFVLGGLAILEVAGMDVTVLLGGAAVIGAAIAFGSQNLIRDYFSGFMMLLENQYSVGDVIRIGSISGLVEDITLRMTVLRDEEGIVHFIPHSQVTAVSNMTHGWSRAVFNISVGYNEDVERVMQVLMELARDLRKDPVFGQHIIAEPEMLGVESLSDSATVVKFLIKTRPMRQWAIKREMLRRIKEEFSRRGIEMPFPHRVVYYRAFPEKDEGERDQTDNDANRQRTG